MQGVHESKGVTDDYLRLESLIQKVVSPYLGTHGLYSRDGSSNLHCSSCLLGLCVRVCGVCRVLLQMFWCLWVLLYLGFSVVVLFFFSSKAIEIKSNLSFFLLPLWIFSEKRLQHSWPCKPGNSPVAKNPVVRSKSYNVPMLTPVVEYDVDSSTGTGIRRHSVSEMTSCMEESGCVADSTTNTSTSSLTIHSTASTDSAALSGRTTWLTRNIFTVDYSFCIDRTRLLIMLII